MVMFRVLHAAMTLALAAAAVVELTPETFNKAGMPGTWVVKFFSPYCHTCNLYAPVFLEAVHTLEAEKNDVNFGQVNCVEQGDLCSKMGITGWPAIKVYTDAEFLAETAINREYSQVLVDFVRELPGGKSGGKVLAAASATVKADPSLSQAEVSIQTADPIGPQPGPKVNKDNNDKVNKMDEDEKDTELKAQAKDNKEKVNKMDEETASVTGPSPAPSTTNSTLELECVEEFDKITKETAPGLWFVKFFSPQCGHCQQFAPVWEKVAHAYPDAQFGQMNCIDNADMCRELGVKAWPEVKAFRDGEFVKDFEERQFTWKGTTRFLKKFGFPKIDEDDVDDQGALKVPATSAAASAGASASASASAGGAVPVAIESGSALDRPAVIRTQPLVVNHASGESLQLNAESFDELVTRSNEPWMIKFFHPSCPHCLAMAPEWDRYAAASKDNMNVAHVNCQTDLDHCLAQGVKSFPTIRFYVGSSAHEFIGHFELQEFQNYDRMQTGAQVLPIDTHTELSSVVNSGLKDGMSTFVYLFDASATTEDWEALAKQAQKLPALKSVVYHSSLPEIFTAAGIEAVGGSHLIYAGMDNGNEFFYRYPGTSPRAMRDQDAVIDWVNKVRFSGPVRLAKDQVTHLSTFAPVSFVHIGDDPGQLAPAARESFDKALEVQAKSQTELRDQRSQMHKKYADRGLDSVARSVLVTPIEAPLVGARSYSFIHPDDWAEQFASAVPTALKEGENRIVAVDWYNNRFVDSIEGEPLTISDLDEAAALLSSPDLSTKFSRKLKGSKHFNPAVQFKPDLNLGQNIKAMEKHHQSIGGVFIVAALALVLAKPLRRAVRSISSSQANKGPILTGKMD